MGRWNRRHPPRSNNRRYRDYDWSPPRETYRDPEFGEWQDNVPMWEKKFCFLSGVPWEKVLSSKKFMHCQSEILEWDDTAGKEAFDNAKEWYWAKLNGGKCETRTPGPDAYIEEIDWNPSIDPELMEDLDRTFFVPDDKESRFEDIVYETKVPSFGSLKDPDGTLNNSNDPWGCDHAQSSSALKDKATGFSQWDDPDDVQEEPTNDVSDNPWERGHASTSQASKIEATGWNQRDDSVDVGDKPKNAGNSWERRDRWDDNDPWQRGQDQTSQLLKNQATGWNQSHYSVNAAEKRSNNGNSRGYHDRPGTATANNGSQGGAWSKTRDCRPQSYSNNGKNADDNGDKWRSGKGWQDRSSHHNGPHYSANATHTGTSKDAKNHWGQKQFGQYGRPRSGFPEGREDMAGVCRKREGPGQNVTGYKGPRLQYFDQTSRRWNNGRQ